MTEAGWWLVWECTLLAGFFLLALGAYDIDREISRKYGGRYD